MAEGFPIRDAMRDCASEWNKMSVPISPFLAAAQVWGELKHRHQSYDSYAQTVITGGGHVYDPSLAEVMAVERNIDTGLRVGKILHDEGVIDLNSVAEAAAMPTINGWFPDDWMTFWPLIIAKPDFTQIRPHRVEYLEDQLDDLVQEHIELGGLDMEIYRDRGVEKSTRLGHYLIHINAVREMLTLNKVPINPVSRVISLVGTDDSVGSTAERAFAKSLGIRIFRSVLAKVEPLTPEELSDRDIGERIKQLRNLGVQALEGDVSQQFLLMEDRRSIDWHISSANQPSLF